ncbi:hypothetical protein [Calycomorphotria hydatis]|uniref:Uncharacterized protein n=1 Tax=Calycomorphotria hydatis TaxID=2528027 RepID=A0A517T387_9PLAN|nr:hypothetical protein [Calycomorphotria hydatis]QDT62838.1 hypothetical protein V22_00360 [Calycomorphotria hydatis]
MSLEEVDQTNSAEMISGDESAYGTSSIIVASGLATTAVSLVLGYFLEHQLGWGIFNLYPMMIPLGSVLLGFCAGSGYGIATLITHGKITKPLLTVICVLLVISYVLGEYIEYSGVVAQLPPELQGELSFFNYYDAVTREFAIERRGNPVGGKFGVFGYAIRVLEVLVFTLSGAAIPLYFYSRAYCDRCRAYMSTTKPFAILPAAGHSAEQEDKNHLTWIRDSVESNSPAKLVTLLSTHADNSSMNEAADHRTHLILHQCETCGDAELDINNVTGHEKKLKSTRLERFHLPSGFVKEVLGA